MSTTEERKYAIPDNNDDVEKMNWLIVALNVYNKYLLRILKLQIDTAKLCSAALIIESEVQLNDRIKLISESYNDSDKLAPARHLGQTTITNILGLGR